MSDLKRWLYEHKILIAHDRELKRLIANAINIHEDKLESTLQGNIGANTLELWARELGSNIEGQENLQHWLWSVPLSNSTVQMGELCSKIDRLYTLKVQTNWPTEVNEIMVRHYARRCADRPPSISKRIKTQSRRLEAACFMRYALCTSTDHLLAMLRRWLQKVTNEAAKQVEAGRPDLEKKLNEFIGEVRALAIDKNLTTHAELSTKLCELADNALKNKLPSRRSLIRLHLMIKSHQSRAILAKLVLLPFEAQTQHPVIDALNELRDLYAKKSHNELPDSVGIHLGRVWRDVINGADRNKALVAFEWATLFALRVALRNGSVYVGHSFAFRSQAALLIPKTEWEAKRNSFYGRLALPQDPKEFLEPITDHINQGLERLKDACVAGEVSIDTRGVHIEPLVAERTDAHLNTLRTAIFSRRPVGQVPTIILEIDSSVRFSWILLGREPRSRSELLLVYAAVLAHGTSLSAADISRMVPELSPPAIRQMMGKVADERKLRHAADAILEFMRRHPITAHWGCADLASSDMMSLETTRTVWQARTDPRRRTASIGIYSHKQDRWGIFYDQPILLKERQAGPAIEGVVRQTGSADVSQLAVDTHGYTDFAMAQSKLLGFDLCPWLAHMRDRRLHVPLACKVPTELVTVVDCDVRTSAIEAVYDELVRVAASISTGQCSAVQALQRFGASARGQDVYDGGVHLGRMLRTIFLIDLFINPSFQRELRHVLNRGEAVHNLYRALHTGKIPAGLAKRHDSLVAVSSSLSLLSNCLMAWNTIHMDRAKTEIESIGGEPLRSEDLRKIAPTNLEGINLRGTLEFPIADFASRILPNSLPAALVAAKRSA